MTSRRKRSTDSAVADAAATTVALGSKRMMNTIQEKQLPSSDICTCWPANPAFDLKRVLLRPMLFINEEKTKYVSVEFYPPNGYQPL